jgi:putative transposase
VVDTLGQLSRIFAIGICTYAVVINHYHLVLKVDAEQVQGWNEGEVTVHWAALIQWPLLVRRWYQRY